jgi:hypothetical protein
VAREAGATVIERHDPLHRGKGYALAHIFRWSREARMADAVVVVDADSKASANLLESFAVRIELGSHALQAHYGVLNASASWRTRLMAIALGSIHKLRSRARERLGVSCGIRGNGWCVTHELLDQIPYQAYSLTEDVEFGVDLGLAGHRVAYCDEAHVNGEMVTTESAARSQRQRWEGGRFRLICSRVPILLRRAVIHRVERCGDVRLCDCAFAPESLGISPRPAGGSNCRLRGFGGVCVPRLGSERYRHEGFLGPVARAWLHFVEAGAVGFRPEDHNVDQDQAGEALICLQTAAPPRES